MDEVEKVELVAKLMHAPLNEYGTICLRVKDKYGQLVPFQLNRAQRRLHNALARQLKTLGFVRALVLKGRQQGVSTYVAARYYRKSSMFEGTNVYILSHEQPSSDNLFDIVDRYHRHNPLAPHVGVSNEKELVFDLLDSTYQVATAGQKAGGRGRTIRLYHGSEVAFWMNAPAHFAGSVQGVALTPGSEIILESTANGPGGEFYERWQDALAGRGDYIAVFLPWFLSEEYAREPEPGFELSSDAEEGQMSEVEYAEMFQLSLAQMAWRRAKIIELRSEDLFRQEYPAVEAEAWVSPGHDPFIKALQVLRARKRTVEGVGPLIFGIDPASMGGDRFSVAARRGSQVLWVQYRNKIDAEEGKAWIKSLIEEHNPARVNIDAGNIGNAIVSGLKLVSPHFAEVIRGVNFGGTSQRKLAKPNNPGPKNRRAEMWERTRDWLALTEGVSIPDDDALQADLCAPRLKPQLNNDFLLESKKEMKARGVRSPDLADAIVLTFAQSEMLTNYADAPKVNAFGNIDAHVRRPAIVDNGGDFEGNGDGNSWMGY